MQNGGDEGSRVVVDAMGADLGVAEVVRGVGMALEAFPQIPGIVMVGKQRWLERLTKKAGLYDNPRLAIAHASEVVTMEDKPSQVLRRKKDASMLVGCNLVKEGKGGALISCGNTGALMSCGTVRLRPMEGVKRPAIAAIMPARQDHFLMIDAGANPNAKPLHLVHNAILGSCYMRAIRGKESPTVALLTIGTEEGKGNERIAATHELLKAVDGVIDYVGLIEGFEVFYNKVDVVVTDGFTGNVVLKCCESLFMSIKDFLKDEIKKTPFRMTGALLSGGAYKAIKKQLDPDQTGGAPLLGLRGNVIKAHGSSNRVAIMNGIRVAHEMIENRIQGKTEDDIQRANAIIADRVTDEGDAVGA